MDARFRFAVGVRRYCAGLLGLLFSKVFERDGRRWFRVAVCNSAKRFMESVVPVVHARSAAHSRGFAGASPTPDDPLSKGRGPEVLSGSSSR